jgi:flagellar motor switch protein FliM
MPADGAFLPAGHQEKRVGGPNRPGSSRRQRSAPQPYDFRRPSKLSREHVRPMQMAMETFARHWSTLLTTTLRAVGQVQLESVQQVTYDEYVSGLGTLTVMVLLDVPPLEGAGILQIDQSVAMVTLDHLLGGPGRMPQPERPFTDIETSLHTHLFERILPELRYALESLVRLEPRLRGIEHNPQFVQAAGSSDMMLVSTFSVRVGAAEGQATLSLPFGGMFGYLEQATQGRVGSPDPVALRAAELALADRVTDLLVDVSVRFSPTTLDMPDVLRLQPGDVLPLRHPARAPLAVTAAGVTFAYAVPGSEGKRLACRVVTPPEEPTP